MHDKESGADYVFGNRIVPGFDGQWRWADDLTLLRPRDDIGTFDGNGEVYRECLAGRVCPRCKKSPGDNGHDPCISNLSGVSFACCGHGVHDGYIMFEDGRIIRGDFTTLPGDSY